MKYLLLFTIFVCSLVQAEAPIRLQLKSNHQFQSAGYYAAKELGFYKDAGLEVELLEASPETDPAEVVLRGDAEFGVGSNSLVLHRQQGKPVVVLAVIMQHSPSILLMQRSDDLQNIQDLAHKKVMIEPLADELIAYLNQEQIPLDSIQLIRDRHNIQDFIDGKVDAISAYDTDETYLLNQLNIDYYALTPRSAGIDFYGDNLFTTEQQINEHPDRVRNFRAASLRGWTYAMQHPQQIIDLILKKYPSNKGREYLLYESRKMSRLMHPELISVGDMFEGRWRHIAQTYVELGMLPEGFSLDGFIYQAEPHTDYFWMFFWAGVSLIIVIALVIYIAFSNLNKKLLRLLHIKSQFTNIGESVNNITHQWKQPLNELSLQFMLIEKSAYNSQLSSEEKDEIMLRTDKCHDILEHMASKLDLFRALFRPDKSRTSFKPCSSINHLLQLIEDNFKIRNINITKQLDEDIILSGDKYAMTQVLFSILNNARDIFEQRKTESPIIHIHLYQLNNSIHIDISDNGGGIKVKPLDRIFKPGYSNKNSSDSGLGLYIARNIIEDNYQGQLNATTTEDGATFHISIPVSDKTP
jgi:ABC-type nitrate/sulfonate/bicarbonate transport system substrate-binding protein/nitrogen-specific signal transduction histidine kinase